MNKSKIPTKQPKITNGNSKVYVCDVTTDECSGCSASIWRCDKCQEHFKPEQTVNCVLEGERHFCQKCFDVWCEDYLLPNFNEVLS